MNRRIYKLLAVVTFVGASATAASAAPRTLANGAPAPGNTVAKGKPRIKAHVAASRALDRAQRALVAALAEEKEAKHQLASQPRTLPNGAPACGNTGGKAPACTAERAEKLHEFRVDRARYAAAEVLRARQRVHEATRKLAIAKHDGGYADRYDDDDEYS